VNGHRKLSLLNNWYRKGLTSLYNYIVYRVGDAACADEIAAAACQRALERIDQYDPRRGSLTSWVFGIAQNLIRDHFRAQSSQPAPLSLEDLSPIEGHGKTPEEQAINAERFQTVIALLDGLTDKEREVIALRYGGDFKYREIAAALDITTDHVGVLLHRALNKLRDALNEEGGNDGH
jgi:RNA polymerase sigma-70 factor (ECF subfamily)